MNYLPPIASINRVTFFKRDELTTDLICCEIESDNGTMLMHEEMDGWAKLIEQLSALEGFDSDWFVRVSQPPFEPSPHVAFDRGA